MVEENKKSVDPQETPVVLDAEPVTAPAEEGQAFPGAAPDPNGAPYPTPEAPVPPAQAQQPYYYTTPPQQPYYQQAPVPPVVSSKDHVAAGLLGIFLGSLGIHKFYLGYNTAGFIMLAVTILGSFLTLGLAAGVMGLIGLIEGIIYLTKSQSDFEYLYVFNKKEWF